MKSMVRLTIIMGCFLLLGKPLVWASSLSLTEQKKQASHKLRQRKKGFDQYLKKQEQRENRRIAQASKMKLIRKRKALKKEQARRSFVRKTKAFPQGDYKKFLRRRQQKRAKHAKYRYEYGAVQKELKKIHKNKKYRIDGKKEFQL